MNHDPVIKNNNLMVLAVPKKLTCADRSLINLILCMKQEVFLNSPESMATEGQACDDMKKFVSDKDNGCSKKLGQITLIDKKFWRSKRRFTQ